MAVVSFPQTADENQPILVELEVPTDNRFTRVARTEDGLLRAGATFEAAISGMKPISMAVMKTLQEVSPDEIEVELGFKMTAESGVILAKAGGEAHIVIKLAWKRQPAKNV